MSPIYLRLPTHQLETSLEMKENCSVPLENVKLLQLPPNEPRADSNGLWSFGDSLSAQGVRTQSCHSMQLNSVYLEIFCTFSKNYGFFVL